MKISLKKKIAAAAAAATILGGGSLAYAYWTTTGAGTGSGTAAAANGTVVLSASFSSGALFPGGSVPVTFTGANAGATNLYVGTISSVVTTSDVGCLPADFSIANVVSNTIVPAGATATPLGASSLVFANTAVNQDACKSATITLTVSST